MVGDAGVSQPSQIVVKDWPVRVMKEVVGHHNIHTYRFEDERKDVWPHYNTMLGFKTH